MDKSDKIALVFGASALLVLVAFVFSPNQNQSADHKEPFEVVDSYHGCDIIRYTDITNRWHYFMKCND